VTHVAEKHPAALAKQWVTWMWPIEPIHYVGCASPAALLYQNGAQDAQVPPADALRFQEAGSEPKTVLWYKDGHHIASLQAFHDQANWLRGIIGIASYRMAFPAGLRGILALWFLLTAASLVFLIFDLRRTGPAPAGAWFLWLLTTVLLGPLGIAIYWLSFRRTRDAGRSDGPQTPARRALGSAAWAAAGTMTGLILVLGLIINLQMTLLDNFAVAIALFVLVLLLPIGTSRLSFAVSRWLSRSDERFLKAARRPFRAEVVSTLLVLLAACPMLGALLGAYFASWSQPRWMMWGLDLLYPPLWAGFSLATLAGMLIAYPFHLWMVHRGTIRWGEMTAASPRVQR
jgi:hypothetical protein